MVSPPGFGTANAARQDATVLDTSKPFDTDRIVRLTISLALLAALVWLVGYVADVLVPLALALLLAYLLNPAVSLLERRLKNRTVAVLVAIFALLVVLAGVLALLVPVVSGEFSSLVRTIQDAATEGSPLRQRMADALPERVDRLVEAFLAEEDLQRFLRENAELQAAAVGAVRWAVPQLWGVVTGALAFVAATLQVVLVLLYLIFILIDYRRLEGSWKDYLPPKYRDHVVAFLSDFSRAMSRYFRGQFVVAMCVGVLFAVGFLLVGIRMAILLGLFIGLLNMVPYLQVIGLPPAYLLAVLTALDTGGNVLWYVVGVTLVFVAVQALQEAVITPRVMGRATGLRPVVILFCVLFWGKLLGLLGLLLAIPLTCLGLAYYHRLLARQTQQLGSDPPGTA